MKVILLFTVYFGSAWADFECGFENDPGFCRHFKKCPLEKKKNLTFLPKNNVNTFKAPKHCPNANDVCCVEPKSRLSPLLGEACSNGQQFGRCRFGCHQVSDEILTSDCGGDQVCCHEISPDSCTGQCLRQCPDGWREEKATITATTEINTGAFVIEEKFSADEVLCARYSEKCCIPPESKAKLSNCGKQNPIKVKKRISFGEDADFAEFPWLVLIAMKTVIRGKSSIIFRASGSLITPTVVLTAAHRVEDHIDSLNLIVRAGDYDVRNYHEPLLDQEVPVKQILIHEEFNRSNHINNIALVFVEKPLVMSPNVGIICLPNSDVAHLNSKKCLIAGWGFNGTGPDAKQQGVLQKAQVNLVEHAVCQEKMRQTRLGSNYVLDRTFVCAIGENGEDTCRGDGGSPLVCPFENDEERYFQVGITSWGIQGCKNKEIPGAYVDVSKFIDWINSKIKLSASSIEEK